LKFTYINEGTTDLIVPKEAVLHSKGPATSKVKVFFNPVMEFSRDVSIIVMRAFLKNKKAKLLDGLAGTGARGVRIAYEVSDKYEMVINDHNPNAYNLINKNIIINGTLDCRSENQKLNILLSQESFDYVDIDPFGSPVGFIDPSIRSLRDYGMLAITATDTPPLCGLYKKTCLRRYDARSIKTSYSKEVAARILAGFCVRQAAKYDIALTPILTFFSDHYVRIHFNVKKGAKKADSIRNNIAYISHDLKSQRREIVLDILKYKGEGELSGPLWIGDLHDRRLLGEIKCDPDLGCAKKIEKYVELWKEEATMPPYFYEINEISSLTKTQPKPLLSIIKTLEDHGFLASKTHFSPNAFKTDCDISEIQRLISEI
jgi:tRNA (guanine26-N2/guanine27-N2)-dimethyltransferase